MRTRPDGERTERQRNNSRVNAVFLCLKNDPRLLEQSGIYFGKSVTRVMHGEPVMQENDNNKTFLSIGGRMTPKAANIAGIILALSAMIASTGFAIALIMYVCR